MNTDGCPATDHARVLPGWVGLSGVVVSVLYFLNQGDIMSTAIPDFPTWDLAGLIGSSTWGLWVAALGVAILRAPRTQRMP